MAEEYSASDPAAQASNQTNSCFNGGRNASADLPRRDGGRKQSRQPVVVIRAKELKTQLDTMWGLELRRQTEFACDHVELVSALHNENGRQGVPAIQSLSNL